jgi:linoleoyl-CoA desaturase
MEVREIAERYGQVYNNGSLWQQFATVLKRIWIYRRRPVEPLAASV